MADNIKRIAITGADGFIGRNLCTRLREAGRYELAPIIRSSSASEMSAALGRADAVVHLAGVNRPTDEAEFQSANVTLTEKICIDLDHTYNSAPIIFASSIKAIEPSAYGQSKAAAEKVLLTHAAESGSIVTILRLPNVFGKWCRPNYNSAVATFSHNVANGLPITIHDPTTVLQLVYIDDVCTHIMALLDAVPTKSGFSEIQPSYTTTVGKLAETIQNFHTHRASSHVAAVGSGLDRALYATYLSYLSPAAFAAPLVKHEDARGWFSEFVKTDASGQVSVFTAHPGITRGGHYHHTKAEKFLVIQGTARFRFRNIATNGVHEITTSSANLTIVETVPGWAHDVTNVGDDLMICVLWANELFDPNKPDTIAHKV